MTAQEREALAKAVKEAWNGVARHIYHAQTHEYELPDHPALAAREEARGSCTCRHPPEGMIGWDRGMVDRECPVHGHEALPERRDPQMEKVIEAVQGARGQSNATRVMMSLDLLLEGAEEAIDDGGMLDPVSVKAIVLRGLTAAREDTERPDGSQGHRLDRSSFFCGYYSAANTLLYETIKPSNNPAVKDFAEHAWKATGVDAHLDTEDGVST